DDTSNLAAVNRDNWNFKLGPHEYLVSGTDSNQGWVIHQDYMRVEGYNWSTVLTNASASRSIINVGDAAKVERVTGNAIGWITFKDQPQPSSTGSENNEHPLHFIAANHPLAYFNRFINCGLG